MTLRRALWIPVISTGMAMCWAGASLAFVSGFGVLGWGLLITSLTLLAKA